VCCQIVILPRKGLDSYHDDDDSATLRRLELELYEDSKKTDLLIAAAS